jgi:hypothetical protein
MGSIVDQLRASSTDHDDGAETADVIRHAYVEYEFHTNGVVFVSV